MPMYTTSSLVSGKCNIMLSLNKLLCKILEWRIAFIMFMNAHANFTWFHLKVTSCVHPSIFGPPYNNKVQLSIMAKYFMFLFNISWRGPPFHHNMYASMVFTSMAKKLMTLGCSYEHANASIDHCLHASHFSFILGVFPTNLLCLGCN